jgi:ribonuclease G
MNKELIISSDFVDFALLKDGKLIEYTQRRKSNFQVGDIFMPKYETCCWT